MFRVLAAVVCVASAYHITKPHKKVKSKKEAAFIKSLVSAAVAKKMKKMKKKDDHWMPHPCLLTEADFWSNMPPEMHDVIMQHDEHWSPQPMLDCACQTAAGAGWTCVDDTPEFLWDEEPEVAEALDDAMYNSGCFDEIDSFFEAAHAVEDEMLPDDPE